MQTKTEIKFGFHGTARWYLIAVVARAVLADPAKYVAYQMHGWGLMQDVGIECLSLCYILGWAIMFAKS